MPGLLGIVGLYADGVKVEQRSQFLNCIGCAIVYNSTTGNLDLTFSGTLPATTSLAGSMSAADKVKLDGVHKQGASVALGAGTAIDWSLASVFSKTISGNVTLTFSNAADGDVIRVRVAAGSGNVITWPNGAGGVKWPGGTPPTQTSGGTDVYTFVKEGSAIYGSAYQAYA